MASNTHRSVRSALRRRGLWPPPVYLRAGVKAEIAAEVGIGVVQVGRWVTWYRQTLAVLPGLWADEREEP